VALLPREGGAQSCLGLPSFANPIHITGGSQVGDGWRTYSAGLALGRDGGLFGAVGGGRYTEDDVDGAVNSASAELGMQFGIAGAQLCPVIGGGYGAATTEYTRAVLGPDMEFTQRAATAGLALGVPVAAGAVRLVPNGAVKWEHAWLRYDAGPDGATTTTASNGLLDLGLGVVLWDRLSITPVYSIEFATKDGVEAERFFGLFGSISFGWGR
jgi:hypothetical protein